VVGSLTIRTLFQTIRPGIKLIEQHGRGPRALLPLMVDAFHLVPRGRCNAIGIEFGSNGARRDAGNKAREDSLHDPGLRVVDDELARRTRDDGNSHTRVRRRGGRRGSRPSRSHARTCSARFFEIHFAHQCPQARPSILVTFPVAVWIVMPRKSSFLASSVDNRPGSRKNAIHVFGNDDVEQPCRRSAHQRDEAGTILCRRCGHSAVLEGQHHRHAIASADLAAGNAIWSSTDLSFCRSLEKTSVDGDADHALGSVRAGLKWSARDFCFMIYPGSQFGKRPDHGKNVLPGAETCGFFVGLTPGGIARKPWRE